MTSILNAKSVKLDIEVQCGTIPITLRTFPSIGMAMRWAEGTYPDASRIEAQYVAAR